jgi:hypothetical protein
MVYKMVHSINTLFQIQTLTFKWYMLNKNDTARIILKEDKCN